MNKNVNVKFVYKNSFNSKDVCSNYFHFVNDGSLKIFHAFICYLYNSIFQGGDTVITIKLREKRRLLDKIYG